MPSKTEAAKKVVNVAFEIIFPVLPDVQSAWSLTLADLSTAERIRE
jgi:hypothetical protein